MQEYFFILASIGFATLLMSYLPIWCEQIKISYTIPLLLLGVILYFTGLPLPWPEPIWPVEWTKTLSEFIVIISLMSAGLKIGQRYHWKEWKNPLLLIGITMPLCMLAVFLISYYILKFDLPISILLASVLAPTDPVFASELQLKDNRSIDKRNTGMRYMLTAEAGLNDGLAFPFVFLAILLSKTNATQEFDLAHWLTYYVAYKIIIGILVGCIIGYLYSLSLQKFDENSRSHILNGFIAVSLTLLSYGATELLQGYGFLAVFFTGLLAQYHNHVSGKKHPENEMVLFVEETEKFFLVLWLLFFGGSLASGILSFTSIYGVLFSIIFVLVIRPLFGMIGLGFSNFNIQKKKAISFFGIRGIGSVFYLSYAFSQGNFGENHELYSIVSYIILFSVVIHGLTSQRVIAYFKKHDPE